MTLPVHPVDVLKENNLGVEFHITTDDVNPDNKKYDGLVMGIHLPFMNINIAALDDQERRQSIDLIKQSADIGASYGVKQMVFHPCGVFESKGVKSGTYDRMFTALEEIADYMAQKNLELCIENQLLRPREVRLIYGCYCNEWINILKELGRSNVMLTFDSSHAASVAAHQDTYEKRMDVMWEYLKYTDYITHIHWSDAVLTDDSSVYKDAHMVPGMGNLPIEYHRAISKINAVKLMEQNCTTEAMLKGLAFVRSL